MKQSFKPAWWLPGPHLQTLWPALLRRKRDLNVRCERLELSDGDFLDLGHVGTGKAPLVLILHGLNGSINSHYVNGLLHAIMRQGWRATVMHFRGCSGEPNRLDRSYHSGETGDLQIVIAELLKREPDLQLYIVGYSLGGNVLLKALGCNEISNAVKAAIAISVPFELNKTADHMAIGSSRIYQRHLVKGLISQYKSKFKKSTSPLNNDINKMRTFWDFDNNVTAPLHGFYNAAHYYKESSSRQYLKNIQIPTLILHAIDDPFTNTDSIPSINEVSNYVSLELSQNGGHVGFVSGNNPFRPIYWLEQRIVSFFKESNAST